jgi:hypothetical protein
MRTLLLIASLLALAGCDSAETELPEPGPNARVALEKVMPADSVLAGLAIAPDGSRYVLDESRGLFLLKPNGQPAQWVLDTEVLGLLVTDVVALDSERLAITVENDGYLLNRTTNLFSSYFCYLPPLPGEGGSDGGGLGSEPISVSQTLRSSGIEVKQRTDSVAYSSETRQLFAQPRTTRLDTGGIAGSELFSFDEQGGQPTSVLSFADPNFIAGGMVASDGARLFAGAQNRVFEITPDGAMRRAQELAPTINITGMARDPTGTIWILDGAGRQLLALSPL